MPFWLAEWGYKALFNCCNSASVGVAILMNNNFSLELERSVSDPEGRFIISDIKLDRKVITLASIYAPNEDNPLFFEDIFSHLEVFKSEEIIIGGDFNLVLDLRGDKKGGLAKTHTKALKVIKQYAAKLDLIDA